MGGDILPLNLLHDQLSNSLVNALLLFPPDGENHGKGCLIPFALR